MSRYGGQKGPTTWQGCWTLSLIMGGVGWHLWPLAQHVDMAAIGCAVCWLVAVKHLNGGLALWDTATAHQRLRRIGERSNSNHGQARWASLDDVEKAGMTKPEGLFLGELEGREIYHTGEGSMLAIAGPGQGKSTCLAMQQLLRCQNSTLVMDTKLELFATCGRALEKKGFRVWVINPWAESFAEQFSGAIEARDDGFDPCVFLDPTSANVIDDCALLASLLIPAPGKQKESEDFWRDFSQTILVAFMLLALHKEGRVTLPSLRRSLMAPTTELEAAIEEMEQSAAAFSGVLAEYGARIAGPYVNAPKEFSGGLSGAQKALRVYDAHGPLGRHTSKGGIDFRTFKDQKTVCFIAIPAEKVATHAAWLGMVVTLSMEMIARDRRQSRVTFLLDEFQNLPRLEPVLKGIALYRSVGIQFVFLVQFASALQRLYGESAREFWGCEVVCAFGATSDMATLKLFSELAGQETFRNRSFTSHPDQVLEADLGMSFGLGDSGRPILRPEEARTLPDGKQLIFAKNLPPILADKQSYLKGPRWLRRAASPNPYYRQAKKPKRVGA